MPSNPHEQIRRAAKEREEAFQKQQQFEIAQRKARPELFPEEARQALSRLQAKEWPGATEVGLFPNALYEKKLAEKEKMAKRKRWPRKLDYKFGALRQQWHLEVMRQMDAATEWQAGWKVGRAKYEEYGSDYCDDLYLLTDGQLAKKHHDFARIFDFATLSDDEQRQVIANVQKLGR